MSHGYARFIGHNMPVTNDQVRSIIACTLLPVVALAALAACDDGPHLDPDATIRVAIDEPYGLVPGSVDEAGGAQVLAALFTPLVGFDATGRPYGLAAETVEPSQGGRVWTVKLRGGFTFHNGEPVTASSYIDAWNYGAYRPNGQRNSYHFRRIEGYADVNPPADRPPVASTMSGLAKVDDQTFTVTLTEPFGEFASSLGGPAFYPLPAAAFDGDGQLRDGFEEAPIGNGPFRMVGSWQHGSRIEVERYEDYAGEPARVAGVEFVSYSGAADPYSDLLAGKLDLVTGIRDTHLASVAEDLGDRFLQRPAATFHFLAFPAYEQELADPRIRRAISMAIDRDQIATGLFQGTQTPAHSFVPPELLGARPDSCGAACEFNPDAARRSYAAAAGPATLTITYNADGGHQAWAEASCAQLHANLGVGCVPAAEPTLTDVLTKLDAQQPVGMVRLSWLLDYPSLESYLGPIFTARGSANVHGYRNPEFDALVAAGAAAGSAQAAQAAYQQAEDLLARDLPVIPLRFEQLTIGHSDRVRNLVTTRFDLLDLSVIEVYR